MSKKVLAIDDEVDTLTFYSEVLDDHNYTSITAQNCIEGLKKAREENPDLILLDIMMPKKGGIKTFQELKNDPDLNEIPVIIITGISTNVNFKTLLNKGTTGKRPPEGHLSKPLAAEDLIEEIRRVLG